MQVLVLNTWRHAVSIEHMKAWCFNGSWNVLQLGLFYGDLSTTCFSHYFELWDFVSAPATARSQVLYSPQNCPFPMCCDASIVLYSCRFVQVKLYLLCYVLSGLWQNQFRQSSPNFKDLFIWNELDMKTKTLATLYSYRSFLVAMRAAKVQHAL